MIPCPLDGTEGQILTQKNRLRDCKESANRTTNAGALALATTIPAFAGGFHRYTVEPGWSIPHFEKMLYDNAQLMKMHAQAFAITKNPLYRFVADDVAGYLTRRMMAAEGGFYTAQDSEVKGKEGASYVWTRSEIVSIPRGRSAERFFDVFALTPMPANVIAESLDPKPIPAPTRAARELLHILPEGLGAQLETLDHR